MKTLVTGGAGFIGGNYVLRQILKKGNQICTFDKLTYAGNLNTLSTVMDHPSHTFVQGDICDRDLIAKTISEFKPDNIVHFAAESHVDRSIDGPMEFVNTNIVGTSILLDVSLSYFRDLQAADKEKFRFLHVSTDEVFGSLGEEGMFTESTPYDPSSPYSASKAASDHLVRAWNRTFGLPVLITNCSNNYGPFQFPEKLIPLMVLNCLAEKPLPVYGTGQNIRDWLFVEDHCTAIETVLETGTSGDTYNIGGNTEKTNLEIVSLICDIIDDIKPPKTVKSRHQLITYVKDRPGHDFRYAMDISNIKKKLSWEPAESFESGLRKTIEWYVANSSWLTDIQEKKYQQQRLGVI
mgnify:CR=1 FL=1